MLRVITRFNSILVRLKGDDIALTPTDSLFQFHTGSIKSPLQTHFRGGLDVSIPYWFD